MDELPNWLKPLPGLAILAVAFVVYLNGYLWPWAWAVGVVLLCAGILMIKKKGDYDF